MDTSKVSSKWQVVIPRDVREAEQIHIGSEVAFERTAQGILLRPVGAGKRISPEEVYGILKTRRRAATDDDIARAIAGYLLSRSSGQGKAAFFLGFGFQPEEWLTLADALTAQARRNPVVT